MRNKKIFKIVCLFICVFLIKEVILFTVPVFAANYETYRVNTSKTQIIADHNGNYHSISYIEISDYAADGSVLVTLTDEGYSTNGVYNYWTGDGLIYVDNVYVALLDTKSNPMKWYGSGGYNSGYKGSVSTSFRLNSGKTYVITQKNRVYGSTVESGTSYTIYINVPHNAFKINYFGNGATNGNTNAQSINAGSNYSIQANGFIKPGYIFAGWTTNADGKSDDGFGWTGRSGVWTFLNGEYGINDNCLNLYAMWKKLPKIEINADDMYCFQYEKMEMKTILQNAEAYDDEKDLTNSIHIKSFDYGNGNVVENPSSLDTSQCGDVEIIYSCENQYGSIAECKAIIHIIPKESDSSSLQTGVTYVRFINLHFLETLDSNSVWRLEENESVLKQTLLKDKDSFLVEYLWINDWKEGD